LMTPPLSAQSAARPNGFSTFSVVFGAMERCPLLMKL
jgi:hypothetical protein